MKGGNWQSGLVDVQDTDNTACYRLADIASYIQAVLCGFCLRAQPWLQPGQRNGNSRDVIVHSMLKVQFGIGCFARCTGHTQHKLLTD